jgi:hypothetical protein
VDKDDDAETVVDVPDSEKESEKESEGQAALEAARRADAAKEEARKAAANTKRKKKTKKIAHSTPTPPVEDASRRAVYSPYSTPSPYDFPYPSSPPLMGPYPGFIIIWTYPPSYAPRTIINNVNSRNIFNINISNIKNNSSTKSEPSFYQ